MNDEETLTLDEKKTIIAKALGIAGRQGDDIIELDAATRDVLAKIKRGKPAITEFDEEAKITREVDWIDIRGQKRKERLVAQLSTAKTRAVVETIGVFSRVCQEVQGRTRGEAG